MAERRLLTPVYASIMPRSCFAVERAGRTEADPLRQRVGHERAGEPGLNAADLHDNVLPALVQVGHHAVLPGGGELDAAENLAGVLVAAVQQQRPVGHDLSRPLAERAGLHQQVSGHHLNREAGAPRVGDVDAREARVVADDLRGLADGQRPGLVAGVHLVGGELVVYRLVEPQAVDAREAGHRDERLLLGGGPAEAAGQPRGDGGAGGGGRVGGGAAGAGARVVGVVLVDAAGGPHERRGVAAPAVRVEHHAGARVRDRRVGDDVAAAEAADVVVEVVGVVLGQRRHVEAADPVVLEDGQRLLPELRRVVDDELLGQAGQDDGVDRLGPRRVRLSGRRVVAGHLGLDDLALLDGPDGLAGLPVEGEDEALLGVLDQRRNLLAVHRQVHQHGRGRQVVVPLVAAVDLEVPAPLAGLDVEGEDAAAEQVVAGPVARVALHRRGVGHEVDEAQLGVGRGRRPRRHVARPLPRVVVPRLVPELAGAGDGVELPEHLAGGGVDAHDVAGHVLDAGLPVAGLVADEHHDHPVDHDGRGRGGDHAELTGNAVAGVVAGRAVHPAPPVLDEGRNEVETAGRGEAVERDPAAPVLQRAAGLGVERPQEEGGAGDEDHPAAVHLGIGDALAVGLPGRAQVADGLGLAERPEGLAGGRVDGHHLPAGRGHRVEDAVDVDRRGPVEVVEVGAEVIAPPEPGHLEVREVVAGDLVEGRRAGVPGVAAEVAPLPVLGPREALRRGAGGQHQHGDGGDEAGRPRHEAFRHDAFHSLAECPRSCAAIRGHPTASADARPRRGGRITRRIRQVSEDALRLNQGSLHPALARLEDQGSDTRPLADHAAEPARSMP